jgi:peptide methionine sulfoxide reductase MsrA
MSDNLLFTPIKIGSCEIRNRIVMAPMLMGFGRFDGKPTEKLLDYYFMVIDPLSYNRQGMDMGVQYRTGVFYTDEKQLPTIRKVFAREEEKAGRRLAVLCEPLKNFFSAEEYHQKYLEKNPGGYCHIPPRFYEMGEKQ